MDCATKRSLLEEEIEKLQAEMAAIDSRIALLRSQLAALAVADGKTDEEEALEYDKCCQQCPPRPPTPTPYGEHGLSKEMIYRYSRHLLLPSFGVEGQFKLSNSSILVVGAGGLGSPISMYLAACGVGCLGIVDNDVVELNNLQRQIIHTEAYIGRSKVESAAAVCRAINSSIKVVEYKEALMASNALDIVKKYDIVVDATDNIPSRYMINDCCVILNKPLVSGAALGLEGQLTVYHHDGGPCYRCLFPIPPPTAACQRCSDSGVLGVVPGIIGCLQALEAIKLACSVGEPLSGRMFLFDASSARAKIVKIRGRSLRCDICGENPTLTQQLFRSFDYEKFTETPVLDPAPKNVLLLPEAARLSSKEFKESLDNGEPHVLIDVRPEHHFRIASLPNSVNIPLSTLESDLSAVDSILKEAEQRMGQWTSLYVVCRRGNDSQRAVQLLNQSGYHLAKDIVGGLEAWAKEVNPDFPIY